MRFAVEAIGNKKLMFNEEVDDDEFAAPPC